MSDPRARQMKIKTGVLKRLLKEKTMYEKEAVDQSKRIEKLKGDNADPYVIKKQEEVLQESIMIIPDCQKRLIAAYNDLSNILDTESDMAESSEYVAAKEMVHQAEPVVGGGQ